MHGSRGMSSPRLQTLQFAVFCRRRLRRGVRHPAASHRGFPASCSLQFGTPSLPEFARNVQVVGTKGVPCGRQYNANVFFSTPSGRATAPDRPNPGPMGAQGIHSVCFLSCEARPAVTWRGFVLPGAERRREGAGAFLRAWRKPQRILCSSLRETAYCQQVTIILNGHAHQPVYELSAGKMRQF